MVERRGRLATGDVVVLILIVLGFWAFCYTVDHRFFKGTGDG